MHRYFTLDVSLAVTTCTGISYSVNLFIFPCLGGMLFVGGRQSPALIAVSSPVVCLVWGGSGGRGHYPCTG